MKQVNRALLASAVTLIAAAAISPVALAQNPVEILDGHGTPCEEVTLSGNTVSGGCEFDATSDGLISIVRRNTPSGPPTGVQYNCGMSYTAHVDVNGTGWATNQALWAGSPSCGSITKQCMSSGTSVPWPIQIDHDGAGNTNATVDMCFTGGFSGDFPMTLVQTSETAFYGSMGTVWFDTNPYYGLSGDWNLNGQVILSQL